MNTLKLIFDVLEPGTDTVLYPVGTLIDDEVLTALALRGADNIICTYESDYPIVITLSTMLGE